MYLKINNPIQILFLEELVAKKKMSLLVDQVHCTMCTFFSMFFRAIEQAQTYLEIRDPIEHIFAPACWSVRKIPLFTFL